MANTTTAHIIAMMLIAIIAIAMMYKQIDGQLLAMCIVAISGLGGYEVYKLEKQKSEGGKNV